MNRPDLPQSQNNSLKTEALSLQTSFAINTLLSSRFRITEQLGAGAQGAVYCAKDELLGVDVALKIIEGGAQDPLKIQSIRNEVNIARQLQHPNIIRVHDVFTDGPHAFFTMAYVDGEPLFQRLQRPVSPAEYECWQQQLVESLLACKAVGIKHGDIKPDNVLIDHEGNVRLIDFGIGQDSAPQIQTSGHQHYTAPEIVQTGNASESSDTYSLGKVLEDILASVETSKLSVTHIFWHKKQRSLINQLTHRMPNQRLDLASITTHNDAQNSLVARLTPSGIAATFLALVIVASVVYAFFTTSAARLPADKPVQLVILTAPKYPLLDTINTLLRYPLSTHPNLVLDNSNETSTLIDNLGLTPFENSNQRTDLAAMLAADSVMLIDATPLDSTAYMLQATVLSMPSNLSVFTVTHSINTNTLSEDLDSFANKLINALFNAIGNDISPPDLRYLEALDNAWQQGKQLKNEDTIDAIIAATPDYPGGWVAKSQLALQQGDFDTARNAIETLKTLPNLSQYWRLQGELIRAELNNDLALAQQAINALVDQYPDRPDLLATRAGIFQWAGEDAKAMEDYRSALSLRPNNGQLWFELARLQIINGQIDVATSESLTRALVAFRQAKDQIGESLVLNAFGIAYLRTADNATAARYFNEALALRDAKTQPSERAKTLANIAIATSLIGDYDTAESSLQEAIILLHDLGDLAQEAHVSDTLGFMFEERGQYVQALTHYKHGLDLRVQLNDKVLQPQSMSNVAYTHFLIGDISLAEIYWQQAKSLFELNGDTSHLMRTYQHLAQLSLVKGDNNATTRYLSLVESHNDVLHSQEKIYNHLLYSFLNFANGNLQKAIEHMTKAEAIAKATDDARGEIEAMLWKGEICLLTADWPCLAQSIASVEPMVMPEYHEQRAVLKWLTVALKHHDGTLSSSDSSFYQSLVEDANIPVMTEIKILLDMQERLSLGADSALMTKLSTAIKPTYYQPYLQWLYLKASQGDIAATEKLKQKLALYPTYWRSHLYYKVIPGKENIADELAKRWLSKLTENQASAYQKAYLD
ncbi:serine/threonine protein kinase [Alteromonas sp. V450]|uniref:serine/threonine-protein kinase n=1 Tax=Alteromonas sp. V450 TaxID=1912139 RepID=UPI0008FF5EE5|nr:serine/threonine-protein kinase [Alteromonas sp. V450]OJF70929.1 serine/threonine protein kinase [Alteromonas sp. V450]